MSDHEEKKIDVDPVTGGQKETRLARFDLIPEDVMWALAEHYGRGSKKYADHNWAKGYKWSNSYAACRRHLAKFWMGEDVDAETGSLHVIAAAWHCLALAAFHMRKKGTDDRFKEPMPPPTFIQEESTEAGRQRLAIADYITKYLHHVYNDAKGGQQCQK